MTEINYTMDSMFLSVVGIDVVIVLFFFSKSFIKWQKYMHNLLLCKLDKFRLLKK